MVLVINVTLGMVLKRVAFWKVLLLWCKILQKLTKVRQKLLISELLSDFLFGSSEQLLLVTIKFLPLIRFNRNDVSQDFAKFSIFFKDLYNYLSSLTFI